MSECKGFEIEPGEFSGCDASATGMTDCSSCVPELRAIEQMGQVMAICAKCMGGNGTSLDCLAQIAALLTAARQDGEYKDLKGTIRVLTTMLDQFYSRAKEIERISNLPVDGPRPIQLVRHVIQQYEDVWMRMERKA